MIIDILPEKAYEQELANAIEAALLDKGYATITVCRPGVPVSGAPRHGGYVHAAKESDIVLTVGGPILKNRYGPV